MKFISFVIFWNDICHILKGFLRTQVTHWRSLCPDVKQQWFLAVWRLVRKLRRRYPAHWHTFCSKWVYSRSQSYTFWFFQHVCAYKLPWLGHFLQWCPQTNKSTSLVSVLTRQWACSRTDGWGSQLNVQSGDSGSTFSVSIYRYLLKKISKIYAHFWSKYNLATKQLSFLCRNVHF